MDADHFTRFIALFAVGTGLIVAGGLNCCLRPTASYLRLLVAVSAAALSAGVVFALNCPVGLAAWVGGATAAVLAGALVAGSARVRAAVAAAAGLARSPRARWGLVAAAGFATVCGAAGWFQFADDADIERQMTELDACATAPPMRVAAGIKARTDRGSPVALEEIDGSTSHEKVVSVEERFLRTSPVREHVIKQQAADERSNCHGWVFTGGRCWVPGAQVELILSENGYTTSADPRPGDLAVYRSSGAVSHTALVRYVSDGMPVMVEGKWGAIGVFLHPVDQSCYGTDVTYYRSGRKGHLLSGLAAPASARAGDEIPAE